MVNGWQRRTRALRAFGQRLDRASDAAILDDAGSAASEPSGLNTTRSDDDQVRASSATPAGGFQHWLRRARNASSSLCDSCAALPVGRAERRRRG